MSLTQETFFLKRAYGGLNKGHYKIMAEGPDWYRLTNGYYVPKVLEFDREARPPRPEFSRDE